MREIKSNLCMKLAARRLRRESITKKDLADSIYDYIKSRIKYKEGTLRFLPHIYKTARETHSKRHGNCADQSLLYVAFAHEAGLTAYVTKNRSGTHTRARVVISDNEYEYDLQRGIKGNPPEGDFYEMSPGDIRFYISRGRRIKYPLDLIKTFLFYLAVSASITFTQDYWQPQLNKLPPKWKEIIEKTVEIMPKPVDEIKVRLEDLIK